MNQHTEQYLVQQPIFYFVLELVDFFALIEVKILFIVLDNVLDKAEKTIKRLQRKAGIASNKTIYCSL